MWWAGSTFQGDDKRNPSILFSRDTLGQREGRTMHCPRETRKDAGSGRERADILKSTANSKV